MKATPVKLLADEIDMNSRYLVRVDDRFFVCYPTEYMDELWFDDINGSISRKLGDIHELARIDLDN